MSGDRTRLYRDVANGRIAGVCSGISDHFGFDLGMIRVACILGCVFFPWFTIPVYILMAVTVPVKPDQEGMTVRSCRRIRRKKAESDAAADAPEAEASEDTDWKRFQQGVNRAPRETFQAVRHSFRELEAKLQRMERYVTSRHYDLDREFRDLET